MIDKENLRETTSLEVQNTLEWFLRDCENSVGSFWVKVYDFFDRIKFFEFIWMSSRYA